MSVLTLVAALLITHIFCSVLCGVWSFSSFWSIGELLEQRKRVEKGWFPENPKRLEEKNPKKTEEIENSNETNL